MKYFNFFEKFEFLKDLNFFNLWQLTLKLLENFEAVKPKLKSKILKLKNIRDKCPQRKEKMRPPLDFHAEGKNVVNFWQIVTK